MRSSSPTTRWGSRPSCTNGFADRRVNRVNQRREFFYATPEEVKAHLVELAGELLQFEDIPEALEFHQSQNLTATDAQA